MGGEQVAREPSEGTPSFSHAPRIDLAIGLSPEGSANLLELWEPSREVPLQSPLTLLGGSLHSLCVTSGF